MECNIPPYFTLIKKTLENIYLIINGPDYIVLIPILFERNPFTKHSCITSGEHYNNDYTSSVHDLYTTISTHHLCISQKFWIVRFKISGRYWRNVQLCCVIRREMVNWIDMLTDQYWRWYHHYLKEVTYNVIGDFNMLKITMHVILKKDFFKMLEIKSLNPLQTGDCCEYFYTVIYIFNQLYK